MSLNKFFLLFLLLLFLPFSLRAEEPVLETSCETGGEFGNVITLKFSKEFRFGKLIIKRTAENSDYSRDLSEFKGGNYRLDLNPRGGITGYSIEYGAKEGDQLSIASGTFSCSTPTAQPTEVKEPPEEKSTTPEAKPTSSSPQETKPDITELD